MPVAVEWLLIGLAVLAYGILFNGAAIAVNRRAGRAPHPDEMGVIRALLPAWPDVPVRIVRSARFHAKVCSGFFGWRRTVLLNESDLAPVEREWLATILAHESGHLSARLLPPDVAPFILTLCYCGASEIGRVSRGLGIAAWLATVVLVWAVGKAHWRYEEFQADRRSPSAPEPLCSYWRRELNIRRQEPEPSWLPRFLRYPTVEERIERLAAVAAEHQPGG